MPAPFSQSPSAAALIGDLGIGLQQQVKDETEEQRRRRLLLEQMQQAVSPLGATASLGLGSGAPGGMLGRRR